MAKPRGTTESAARAFQQYAGNVRPSTKTKKTPGRVFGTSSQFRGVMTGVKGDPRK